MTKDPSKASDVLKERKYGAPPTASERIGITPAEKMRVLIALPSVAVYFILRIGLNFGILEAALIAVSMFIGLGFATGLFKRKVK